MATPELDLRSFDYALAPERIAQQPALPRDAARLLVLNRQSETLSHACVRDLPQFLREGDLLVVNATRVWPARLRGRKASGGAAEALLLDRDPDEAGMRRALLRCSGRLREGLKLIFEKEDRSCDAEVVDVSSEGIARLRLPSDFSPEDFGEAPLPPYIARPRAEVCDLENYQTVFARVPGSVAAPTAGLHFTEAILATLQAAGIARAEVVLHVGPGTFRPLQEEDLRRGRLHAEYYELSEATAAAIARTRARSGRIVAIGTTATRVLESCTASDGSVRAGQGWTELFLRPGARFAVVDALLTNFHLPRSSLLLLAAAFAGRERLLDAYAEAQSLGYRFYSYGDAMLIL